MMNAEDHDVKDGDVLRAEQLDEESGMASKERAASKIHAAPTATISDDDQNTIDLFTSDISSSTLRLLEEFEPDQSANGSSTQSATNRDKYVENRENLSGKELPSVNLDSIATFPSQTVSASMLKHAFHTTSTKQDQHHEIVKAVEFERSHLHPRNAFEDVADRLICESRPKESWYSTLTPKDWENLSQQAVTIGNAMVSTEHVQTIPPSNLPTKSPHVDGLSVSDVTDIVPPHFICIVCSDVLVGAHLFDCRCKMGTDRWSCSDCCMRVDGRPEIFECTSCSQASSRLCYGVDEQISNWMRETTAKQENDEKLQVIADRYYRRYHDWCQRLALAAASVGAQDRIYQEQLLGTLLEEEERLFWAKQQKDNQTKSAPDGVLHFWLQHAATAITGVFVASIGLVLISRRR